MLAVKATGRYGDGTSVTWDLVIDVSAGYLVRKATAARRSNGKVLAVFETSGTQLRWDVPMPEKGEFWFGQTTGPADSEGATKVAFTGREPRADAALITSVRKQLRGTLPRGTGVFDFRGGPKPEHRVIGDTPFNAAQLRDILTDQTAPNPLAGVQPVLNQPLRLDLAAGLAGRKLLVVAASIEQRPSRRLLDTLAANAATVARQGFAIVLVHPAVTDEQQVKQWLKDHKLDVTQLILAKDQADAARLMTACGAESLPSMLLTDDKHVVTVVDLQADKLTRLGDIPAGPPQSTTSPAPAAEGGSK
jgi:hypothetical protein